MATKVRRATLAELQLEHKGVHPFLLEKWERIFTMFFDKTANQEVEWNDFYMVVRNVRNLYGAESAQYTYAKKTLTSLFEGLCKMADADGDKHITIREWIELLEKTLNGDHQWFRQYQHFMFKLFDVSGDGVMDLFEYTDGMSAYGFNEKFAKDAFQKWAVKTNGSPIDKVTPELWEQRFNELFFSKDPKAPGNNLLGVIE